MLRNIFKKQVRFNSNFTAFKSALHPEVNEYFLDETKNPNKLHVSLKNINPLFEKSAENLNKELKELYEDDLILKIPYLSYILLRTTPK